MTDTSGAELPDALLLTRVLEKFRDRQGLTLSRLQADRGEAAARLLGLAASRRRASIDQSGLAAATLAVVTECVRDDLSGTQQIVADTVLGLGVCSFAYSRAGLDTALLHDLAANSVVTRRRALLANWGQLHEAVRHTVDERPSDSLFLRVIEPAALRELADQLVRREVSSVGSTGRVTIVGGAVMDATFRTKALPAPETSSQAHGFELAPGGKGLTQAVAAARLGLEVSLLAAVADDRFGLEILRHLRDEGVDTSLIKLVPDARTPFTGVFETELGDGIAANWRNDSQVALRPGDIEARSGLLTDCDAVLLTFEVPRDTAERTLTLAHTDARARPLTIVTPGQPYSEGGVSPRALSQIDYLIAHAWELRPYAPPRLETFDPDPVARHLLSCGVETLCLLVGGGCTIYSQAAYDTLSVPAFPSIYKESSVARDAFCAALVARLIDNDRTFSGQVALWATAAMSCAVADFPLSDSMPDRRRVETLIERSAFGVNHVD
jgi:ribokinase